MSEATDKLALEARRRALEGVEEVLIESEPIGTSRPIRNSALKMFLLTGLSAGDLRNLVN